MAETRYIDGLNQAMEQEMENDPSVIVLGEDVAVGGPFGVTAGLVDRFGDKRVINTPISEDSSATKFSVDKRAGDITVSAVDNSLLANLDGIKLLSSEGPHAHRKTKFDVALEVQGLGVQFEKERTFGYVRADRAFTGEHSIAIRFRFQF